jgi:hypothetical protein
MFVDSDDFRKHFEKSNPSHTTQLQGAVHYFNKVKVKVNPRRGQEGPERESRDIALLSL